MDVVTLDLSSNAGVCVVEPSWFRHTLDFLVTPPNVPLSLSMVHGLRIFIDACILHEKVICPNPYPPQFRHAFDVNDHDKVEFLIHQILEWNFIQTDLRVGDYGNTPWYQEASNSTITLTDLGGGSLDDPDFLDYLDHIAAIGEAFQATVVFDEIGAVNYPWYKQLKKSPQACLFNRYEEQLQKQINDLKRSVQGLSGHLYYFAPIFFHKALADVAQGHKDSLVHAIEDMHNEFVRPYREFIAYALSIKDPNWLLREAEQLLIRQAMNDNQILRIPGQFARLMSYFLKSDNFFLKLLINRGRFKKHGEDVMTEGQVPLSALTDYDYARLYQGFRFLNYFNPQRPTVRDFYKMLKTVFGAPAFTQEELNQYLAKY